MNGRRYAFDQDEHAQSSFLTYKYIYIRVYMCTRRMADASAAILYNTELVLLNCGELDSE